MMGSRMKKYLELIKIKQTILLVFSAVSSYLISCYAKPDAEIIIKLIGWAFLSVSGTTAMNMVLDRDLDAKMFRTMYRPIPRGDISTKDALLFSIPVLLLGLALGFSINPIVGTSGILGFSVDIFLYTYLLKRKSVLNVIVGSFAGGFLALGGWSAHTGSLDLEGLLFFLLISSWSIPHIWSLSIYYKEDYLRAGVPMLPVELDDVSASKSLTISVLVLGVVTISIMVIGLAGPISAIISIPYLCLLIWRCFVLQNSLKRSDSLIVFKLLSPYLGIFLISMITERVIWPEVFYS